MDTKLFLTVFTTVFLAEVGDKTQLATVLFAADRGDSALVVFASASLALIVATAAGVFAGTWIARFVDPSHLRFGAGAGFVLIGLWTLLRA